MWLSIHNLFINIFKISSPNDIRGMLLVMSCQLEYPFIHLILSPAAHHFPMQFNVLDIAFNSMSFQISLGSNFIKYLPEVCIKIYPQTFCCPLFNSSKNSLVLPRVTSSVWSEHFHDFLSIVIYSNNLLVTNVRFSHFSFLGFLH